MAPGDLVVTGDIPLAAQVIERGGHALDPRGELYSSETIRERLTMRDFMDELRGSGVQTGGPRRSRTPTGSASPVSSTGCWRGPSGSEGGPRFLL